jgi:4-diphosphocytidyl-2-C-methyl-D-erythritol kinase
MQFLAKESHVIVWAPAKINLFLEILDRRPDGYHEIETVMSKISLFDTLRFEIDPTGQLRFQLCEPLSSTQAMPDNESRIDRVPADGSNLVVRAVELLRSYADVKLGARLTLFKRIPAAAGLGGGSSDAAAALVAANLGWRLGISHAELVSLAAQLGSDVPFFLYDSPAICRGRGEIVQPLAISGQLNLVVVKPPVELSTANVYNCYVPSKCRVALDLTHRPQHVREVQLFNRLQAAAETLTPWIARTEGLFTRLGVPLHQMTGSGSAYFGICNSARMARRISMRMRQFQAGDVFFATACT